MHPKFFYFDLGNVLINFSAEQMLRQIGEAAGVDVELARSIIFGDGLLSRHESGKLSDREFYEAFCIAAKAQPTFEAMTKAACEIFTLNISMLPIVAQLHEAGHRTGILSNTCTAHWEYCSQRYRILNDCFDVRALSYRIGAIKPEPAIFQAAAEMAGVAPQEIFFVDDLAGHIAGARAVGFDAVQYTSAEALAEELQKRGARFNY